MADFPSRLELGPLRGPCTVEADLQSENDGSLLTRV